MQELTVAIHDCQIQIASAILFACVRELKKEKHTISMIITKTKRFKNTCNEPVKYLYVEFIVKLFEILCGGRG